ncbi:MAG: hypothetical protein CMF48_07325 [Legionellales bacterium]|nr:hypothetical protein [Legionellales bacterium]|tara:strand:- start:1185 stop:1844 length:660 start_codon:yes stop_codon:yes gene_type:complete
MHIQAYDVCKEYEVAKPVLSKLSFDLPSGTTLGISGPSGGGKSTLLQLMGLLDKPTAGQVTHNGSDITALSFKAQARYRSEHIGYVFQQYALLEKRTVWENVALPLLYQNQTKHQAKRAAIERLEALEMGAWAWRKVANLSGGQKQRVAVARALVTQPSLIIADEPTGALDNKLRDVVWDMLKAAQSSNNATLIVVSHDPTLIKRCSLHWQIHEGGLCV